MERTQLKVQSVGAKAVSSSFILFVRALLVFPLYLHPLNLRFLEFEFTNHRERVLLLFLLDSSSVSCTLPSFPIHLHIFTEHFILGTPPERAPSNMDYKNTCGVHSDVFRVYVIVVQKSWNC